MIALLAVEVPEWGIGAAVTFVLAVITAAIAYGKFAGRTDRSEKSVGEKLRDHDAADEALSAKIDAVAAKVEAKHGELSRKIDDTAERHSSESRESMTQIHSFFAEFREITHGRLVRLETHLGFDPPSQRTGHTPPLGVRAVPADIPAPPNPWRKK